ncbi:MAG: TIGR04282 family arsenosugar biosynthesis glycosyltransferase [Vicinamibacteraceae bacterium]
MSHASARTILIFTRAPAAEARAKRLHVRLGAALFGAFLSAWRRIAAETGSDLLVVAPRDSVATLCRMLPGVDVAAQPDGRFDVKLNTAFDLAFRSGANAVLMVGGDSPPLPPAQVRRAFDHLERDARGLVLAPAHDGGVNAIGLTPTTPRPFDSVGWMTPAVHRHLCAAAERLGLTLFETPSCPDLDAVHLVRSLCLGGRIPPLWRAYRWLMRALMPSALAGEACTLVPRPLFRSFSRITRGPPTVLVDQTHRRLAA